MRILSKYILAEFRRFFLITMAAFMMVFVLGDFIEKADDYIENKAAVFDVVRYILYQLPNIAFMVMPVAVMLSTLLAIGMLSKNSEIIAMKASGIPLYRIAMPVFMAALILCGVIFWANETVIPYCNAKADYIRHVKIEKKMARPALKHNRLWFKGPQGEIINIGLIDFKGKVPTCYGVSFYRENEAYKLTQRVDAERMDWVDGKWVLSKGTVYDFPATGPVKVSNFENQVINLPEKPDDFKQVERLSEEMNISELSSYIRKLRNEGYNPTKYVVDLHGKVAFTLANLIMVFVALPFSLKTSRSGGMALGVGICIVIAISYWFIYSFSISLGHAGRFPPLFAAWLTNALFFGIGAYLLLQTDR